VSASDPNARPLANVYDAAFYAELSDEVRSSAEVVVPIVLDLLAPRSILDVGCGHGSWLRVFEEFGVTDVLGADGPHVSRDELEIAPHSYLAHDLGAPLSLGRNFDLVVCLEVAEHLDDVAGTQLVASLVAHSGAVLFSAAIPRQGGAGHINERWQSHWARAFAAHGYQCVDIIRPLVWFDTRVAFWYAQNTLLYVRDPGNRLQAKIVDVPLDLVHPRLYLRAQMRKKPQPPSLRRAIREVPAAARRAISSRFTTLREHETRAAK